MNFHTLAPHACTHCIVMLVAPHALQKGSSAGRLALPSFRIDVLLFTCQICRRPGAQLRHASSGLRHRLCMVPSLCLRPHLLAVKPSCSCIMAQGRPQVVEALLSHPRVLCNIWSCLDLADRASLQVSDFYLHADLRWFVRRLPAVSDVRGRASSSDSSASTRSGHATTPTG